MIDFILHLDTHLLELVQQYGMWIYAILFLIIFSETGLVFAPFLPGDTLLFVTGALCGMGSLELDILMPVLMLAAFCGDNTNYWIGRLLGLRLVERLEGRLIRHEHLEKTHAFYERHGGKTVILARFVPIVRTFAPFVAGIGLMHYRLFVVFSALGSLAWISSITLAGYYFGNIPVIKDNLTLMVLVIVFVSFIPAMLEYWKRRRNRA
jgi:membrane-associated protein